MKKNSTVETAYIYERVYHILNVENNEALSRELSALSRELSATFRADTGVGIGVHLGWDKKINDKEGVGS